MLSLSFRSLISFFRPNSVTSNPDPVSDSDMAYDMETTREVYAMSELPEEHRVIFSEGYQGGPSPLDHLMEDE